MPQFGRSFAKTPFSVTFYRRIVPLLPDRHLAPFLYLISHANNLKYSQKDKVKYPEQEAAPAYTSFLTIKTPYKSPTTAVYTNDLGPFVYPRTPAPTSARIQPQNRTA